MCSFNNDGAQGDVEAIDLTKDFSVHYLRWYSEFLEEENQISREPRVPHKQPSVPLVASSPHQPHVPPPTNKSKSAEKRKGQTLSQILAIPQFHASTSRKRTNTLHCHGRLTTSVGFLNENKEKEDAKNAKDAALEEKRKAREEKRKKKENIKVDAMVKRWIKMTETGMT